MGRGCRGKLVAEYIRRVNQVAGFATTLGVQLQPFLIRITGIHVAQVPDESVRPIPVIPVVVPLRGDGIIGIGSFGKGIADVDVVQSFIALVGDINVVAHAPANTAPLPTPAPKVNTNRWISQNSTSYRQQQYG